ncbi:MAG: FAD-binding protein, partial [Clostridia bacterium]|nr:FAD-binding protein [Clostridia bacterium]
MYNDSVLEAVASATGVKFVSDEDMSKLCSYGTGGKGGVFYPDSVEKCRELIEALGSAGEEYFFLGAGSNVLVSDEGADRAVISTKNLKGISVRGKMVTACAG